MLNQLSSPFTFRVSLQLTDLARLANGLQGSAGVSWPCPACYMVLGISDPLVLLGRYFTNGVTSLARHTFLLKSIGLNSNELILTMLKQDIWDHTLGNFRATNHQRENVLLQSTTCWECGSSH